MEYWSNGVLEYWAGPQTRRTLFHQSITPILHHSNAPFFP